MQCHAYMLFITMEWMQSRNTSYFSANTLFSLMHCHYHLAQHVTHCLVLPFFPLQVGEIGFSGIGQVSLCGLAPLLNIFVSNTMFWVWDHFQKHLIQINLEDRNDFTSWSPPWPPTAPPTCSWPSGRSKTSENGSKWFPIPQNMSDAVLLPKLE